MAAKNNREIRFKLSDDDYKAFGRYRVLYTAGGRKLVNRQRASYLISAVMIAVLFTVFKVDKNFALLAYIVAGLMGVAGIFLADKMILRQQSRAIDADANNPERLHPEENIISFEDDVMKTKTGDDEQEFSYANVKQVDMTEDAIYVWMSDTVIMPLPLHAFSNQKAMEELYAFLGEKTGS